MVIGYNLNVFWRTQHHPERHINPFSNWGKTCQNLHLNCASPVRIILICISSLVIYGPSKQIHSDIINKMILISNILSIHSFTRDLYVFQHLLNNETRAWLKNINFLIWFQIVLLVFHLFVFKKMKIFNSSEKKQ